MEKIKRMLNRATSAKEYPWDVKGNRVIVTLGHELRRQTVSISRDGDDYVFKSVVLDWPEVTRTHKQWRESARKTWLLNADHELVSFCFDNSDRMIGQIRHPAKYLDLEEMALYIQVLARECDRMEYLLSGKDEN